MTIPPQVIAIIKDLAIKFLMSEEGQQLCKWAIHKLYDKVISDEDMKQIKYLTARGGPYNIGEVAMISMMADEDGKHNKDSEKFDFDSEWDDSITNKYADYLYNYIYNYKDSAKSLDPTIDPKQDQIGIMAQDLEKVNPACIEEVQGVKTVNTGKLALMNAGAIADLSRRLNDLESTYGKK